MPLGDPPPVIPCVNSVIVPSGMMRPTRSSLNCVNQTLPSGPAASLADGSSFGASENSVTVPAGVMRPMPSLSVNQMLPSGPSAIEFGAAPGAIPAVKSGRSVPAGVIRPIAPDPLVNHRTPSGPATMSSGCPVVANCWKLPSLGRRRPIVSGPVSANQMFPSGPAAIPRGLPAVVPAGNCVMPPAAVTLATLLMLNSLTQRFPSAPAAMAPGSELRGRENWPMIPPSGRTLSTRSGPSSVTNRFPSGPVTRSVGPLPVSSGSSPIRTAPASGVKLSAVKSAVATTTRNVLAPTAGTANHHDDFGARSAQPGELQVTAQHGAVLRGRPRGHRHEADAPAADAVDEARPRRTTSAASCRARSPTSAARGSDSADGRFVEIDSRVVVFVGLWDLVEGVRHGGPVALTVAAGVGHGGGRACRQACGEAHRIPDRGPVVHGHVERPCGRGALVLDRDIPNRQMGDDELRVARRAWWGRRRRRGRVVVRGRHGRRRRVHRERADPVGDPRLVAVVHREPALQLGCAGHGLPHGRGEPIGDRQ